MEETAGADPAAAALRRLFAAWRASQAPDAGAVAAMTPAMFRATVAERLRALERDMSEVRARVNGLLFVVAGAVVTQVLLRLLGS